MFPWPVWPLAWQCSLGQNVVVGSMMVLLACVEACQEEYVWTPIFVTSELHHGYMESYHVFEQHEPSLEGKLRLTPIGYHVAEQEQRKGLQQETVEFEFYSCRRRRKTDAEGEGSRDTCHTQPRSQTPLKGGDHDSEKKKKQKTLFVPLLRLISTATTPHLPNVLMGGWHEGE